MRGRQESAAERQAGRMTGFVTAERTGAEFFVRGDGSVGCSERG